MPGQQPILDAINRRDLIWITSFFEEPHNNTKADLPAVYLAATSGQAAIFELLLKNSELRTCYEVAEVLLKVGTLPPDEISANHILIAEIVIEKMGLRRRMGPEEESEDENPHFLAALRQSNDPGIFVKDLCGNPVSIAIFKRFLQAKESQHPAAIHYQTIIEKLFEAGASFRVCTPDKEAVIHYAAGTGLTDLVKKILNADNSAANQVEMSQCRTPLIWACMYGQVDVVKLLLGYSPNILFRDSQNKTALDYAMDGNNGTIVRMLQEKLPPEEHNRKAHESHHQTMPFLSVETTYIEAYNPRPSAQQVKRVKDSANQAIASVRIDYKDVKNFSEDNINRASFWRKPSTVLSIGCAGMLVSAFFALEAAKVIHVGSNLLMAAGPGIPLSLAIAAWVITGITIAYLSKEPCEETTSSLALHA